MIVKIIHKTEPKIEEFYESKGPVKISSTTDIKNINFTYGINTDKIVTLKDNYNDEYIHLAIDSTKFTVFLLNDQGQNIQKLI